MKKAVKLKSSGATKKRSLPNSKVVKKKGKRKAPIDAPMDLEQIEFERQRQRRELEITSIREELYRIMDLPENNYRYLVLKETHSYMLISKTSKLKVTHRYNDYPGSMQPVDTVSVKDYCLLFIVSWERPQGDATYNNLKSIDCPIYFATTPWDVKGILKEATM